MVSISSYTIQTIDGPTSIILTTFPESIGTFGIALPVEVIYEVEPVPSWP